MSSVLILILSFCVVARTIFYGIWIIRENNISGGIFVFLLSLAELILSLEYFFKA